MEKVDTATVDYRRRVEHRNEWRRRLKHEIVQLDNLRSEALDFQGYILSGYGRQVKDFDAAVHKANLLLGYALLCLDMADNCDFPGANLGPEPADNEDDQ